MISVYDKKASFFHPPTAFEHISQAIRSFVAFAKQKPDAQYVQFCEDFDLFDIGTFISFLSLFQNFCKSDFTNVGCNLPYTKCSSL